MRPLLFTGKLFCLYKVSIVGIVRRVLPSMSSILYLLDDMTGAPIDARFWLDSEVSNQVRYCDVFLFLFLFIYFFWGG